jgi:ABC-2 type transport system permease protein
MSLLLPVGIVFFLKLVGDVKSTTQAIFLLGGNMTTSIAFGPTSFLITKMGWAKQFREFDYWIALPLAKFTLVFAIITVSLLFALPSLVGVYVIGCLLFGLPLFAHSLLFIPLIPLSMLPLAGLGTLIGCCAQNGQMASTLSNIVIVFVGFLSPMMIPTAVLPLPLQIISRFVPTTYAADAFRAVLSNQVDLHFGFDVLILIFFSVLLLTLSYALLDWRTT